MTLDELEERLRRWGRWYGERPSADDPDRLAPATHPLAIGMQFAPGKRSAVIRQRSHMDRAGQGRRRLMAQAAGVDRLHVVPAAFVDPVPCIETRSGRNSARDWPTPPEVQSVQRAALDLHRIDTLRGLALRVHYCMLGDLQDKANAVTLRLGSPVKVRAYRDAVREARFWMLGRLAA